MATSARWEVSRTKPSLDCARENGRESDEMKGVMRLRKWKLWTIAGGFGKSRPLKKEVNNEIHTIDSRALDHFSFVRRSLMDWDLIQDIVGAATLFGLWFVTITIIFCV